MRTLPLLVSVLGIGLACPVRAGAVVYLISQSRSVYASPGGSQSAANFMPFFGNVSGSDPTYGNSASASQSSSVATSFTSFTGSVRATDGLQSTSGSAGSLCTVTFDINEFTRYQIGGSWGLLLGNGGDAQTYVRLRNVNTGLNVYNAEFSFSAGNTSVSLNNSGVIGPGRYSFSAVTTIYQQLFLSVSQSSGNLNASLSLTTVPAPATSALLLLGVGAASRRGRRA